MPAYLARDGVWQEVDYCGDFDADYPNYAQSCVYGFPCCGFAANWLFMYTPPAGNTQKAISFGDGKFWCGNLYSYVGNGAGFARSLDVRTTAKSDFTVPSIHHYGAGYYDEFGVIYWMGPAGQAGYFGVGRGRDNDTSLGFVTEDGNWYVYNGQNDARQGQIPFTTDSGCYLRAGTWIYNVKSWTKSSTIDHFSRTHAQKMALLTSPGNIYINDIGDITNSAIINGKYEHPEMDVTDSRISLAYKADFSYLSPKTDVLKLQYRIDDAGVTVETRRIARDNETTAHPFIVKNSCLGLGYASSDRTPNISNAMFKGCNMAFGTSLYHYSYNYDEVYMSNASGSLLLSRQYQPNSVKLINTSGALEIENLPFGGHQSYGRMDYTIAPDSLQNCPTYIGIYIRGNIVADYDAWYNLQIVSCTFPATTWSLTIYTGLDELTDPHFGPAESQELPATGEESGWYDATPFFLSIYQETFEIGVNTATQSWTGTVCTYTGLLQSDVPRKDLAKYKIPTNTMPQINGIGGGATPISGSINGDIVYDKMFKGARNGRVLNNKAKKYTFEAPDPDEGNSPPCA